MQIPITRPLEGKPFYRQPVDGYRLTFLMCDTLNKRLIVQSAWSQYWSLPIDPNQSSALLTQNYFISPDWMAIDSRTQRVYFDVSTYIVNYWDLTSPASLASTGTLSVNLPPYTSTSWYRHIHFDVGTQTLFVLQEDKVTRVNMTTNTYEQWDTQRYSGGHYALGACFGE